MESVELDNKLIEQRTIHKRQALAIIAYLDATNDSYKINQNKITVINGEDTSQLKKSKVSISKPKGDIEMRNITYRPKEKRYIGRKQILNKIITVYAKTQAECLQKLNAEVRKIKFNFQQNSNQSKFTVIQYWDKWYRENKEPFIAESTKEDYEIVRRKITPIHHIPLTQLTKDILLSFFATLEENRTKEKMILFLSTMMKTALAEGKIKLNPFATIVVKTKKRKPKPPFNYDEQVKIIENLKGKVFEPIILTYLTTGLRKTELDFQHIEQNIKNNVLTAINLKGHDREIRYKKIKLSDAMVKIINDNKDTFHKYNARLALDHFTEFLKELKIKGSLVTCRHTFATNCYYLGKDKLIISREMGHTTSQITDENYIEVDYNLSKEKILKLYNNLYNLD